MPRRVDDPRRVQAHNSAKEHGPQYQPESADSEQDDREDRSWRKMVFREPDMKSVTGQIGDVAFECCNVLAQRITSQDPTRVCPPLAIARGVRITFLVRELVMLTMDRYPEQRAAFQSHHAAERKKVLKPLGSCVRAMGEQPVITHAESQAACNPVQKDCDQERIPGEEKERRHCTNVK